MSNYKLDPPGLDPLYTFKPSEPVFAFTNTKPSHNIIFHNQDGKQVGALDFNGPEMTFSQSAVGYLCSTRTAEHLDTQATFKATHTPFCCLTPSNPCED